MNNKGLILAVDDAPLSLDLLVEILTEEGYPVRAATSGQLALAAIAEQTPELILLDVFMPDMDGFAVLRHLKAQERTCKIPVIFLSAATDTEQRMVGFQLGAVDFITKPFQPDELLARVGTHLELFHLRTQLEQRAADLQSINEQLLLEELTERNRSEAELRESQQLLQSILDVLPLGIWIMDAEGTIVSANAAGKKIWGGMRATTLEQLHDYKAWWLETGKRIKSHEWAGARALEKGETSLNEEIEIECFDGTHKIILNSAVPIRGDDGHIRGVVAVNQDITERKAAENEIKNLAFYDPLTHLPNRRLLMDRLRRAVAVSVLNQRAGALLFIDLDHFKMLNDSFGHDHGDLFLQQVAERLSACVREGDTVARLGGDEFIVMLADLHGNLQQAALQAQNVGKKIQAALHAPYRLCGHEHHSSASIGVALFGDHQKTAEQLLKDADSAMYAAKSAGRNTLCFFNAQDAH